MELLPSHAFSTLVRYWHFFKCTLTRFYQFRISSHSFFKYSSLIYKQFVFSFKFPVLQENLDVYMGLQQFIVTTGTSKSLSTLVLRQLYVLFGDGDERTRRSPSLRSEAEHLCREWLPSAPLLSQGPELSPPGRGSLGRTFHRGGLCRTLQRCRGSGREVSPPAQITFSFYWRLKTLFSIFGTNVWGQQWLTSLCVSGWWK